MRARFPDNLAVSVRGTEAPRFGATMALQTGQIIVTSDIPRKHVIYCIDKGDGEAMYVHMAPKTAIETMRATIKALRAMFAGRLSVKDEASFELAEACMEDLGRA